MTVRGFTAREHAEFAAMAEREAVLSGAFADDDLPPSLLAHATRPRAPPAAIDAPHHPAAEEASGIDRTPIPATASEKVRSNATKILALRMLQGYSPSSEKCAACRVPLMDRGGIVQCVVCTNAAARSGKKGVGAAPPTSIVLERPAESRNDGEDVVATDEGFELLLHPHQERQSADDSGREDSTLGGSFVSMVGGDDLFQRTLSTKDSAEEAGGLDGSSGRSSSHGSGEEGSASSGGSRRKVANARLLERIDEMARRQREARELQEDQQQGQQQEGQKQQGQQQLPSQKLDLPDPPPRGHASEHHSTGASTDATKVIDNSWRSGNDGATPEAFAAAIGGGTHSIPDEAASVGTPPTQTERSVRGTGEGEGEEAAYRKGRAFASAIIRETNSILDDLVSVEEGRSVCSSTLTPIAEGKVLEGGGSAAAPRGRATGPTSSALPPRSPPVSPPARTKRPPATAGAPPVHPPRASRTPPTPGQRKRMTINSLSYDQGLSRDHTRALQSTGGGSGGWLGRAPRRLEHAIPEEDGRDGSVAEASAKVGGGNGAAEGRQEEAKNSFFDELRHKALLSKAAHCEGKLRTAMKGASVLRIDATARGDGAGVVEARLGTDDVSALESPSRHFLHSGTLSPAHRSEAAPSATNEEMQQRQRAANNRQRKHKEWEAERAAAHTGARMKRIESCVPDDEKAELARKCLREEGVALPFDERTPRTVPATRPGPSSPVEMAPSPSSRTTHVTSLAGSRGTAASAPSRIPSSMERRGREPLASTLALTPLLRVVAGGLAGVQESVAATEDGAGALTNATDDAPASTDEPSLASLSSSVQRQTARIVALEADALKKHREAEAAAAAAKEALEEMVRTRHAREDEEQEYSAASASQYSGRAEEENGSYGDDGDSTALASASYFDEAARRGRSRSPRAARMSGVGYYTPEPAGSFRHRSRPPPLRVDAEAGSVGESRGETSTCSSLDMPEDGFQDRRHHRSLSLPRQSGGRMQDNLLLPSLGSPDPAGIYPNEPVHHGRRERAGGSHRSHSASPRRLRAHRRREFAQPFASRTVKPNCLLPYSPRGGYAPPSFYGDSRAMRSRPVPLSRRIESEPMAARGYHHLSASCLPPYSPRGYSAALEARMAGLDLNNRNNSVPYGGVSMTPKSRYEQRHFGFEPRNGFDQRFDSLSLARHQADQQLLHEERMHCAAVEQAQMDGYFATRSRFHYLDAGLI